MFFLIKFLDSVSLASLLRLGSNIKSYPYRYIVYSYYLYLAYIILASL